jgi:acetate kinase
VRIAKHFYLVLNAGSSSLKFSVFEANGLLETERGQISGIGTTPVFETSAGHRELHKDTAYLDGLTLLFAWLNEQAIPTSSLLAVGHRIVHGGTKFVAPMIVTDETQAELEKLRALAPLHLPFGLGVLREARVQFPNIKHIACFDTAFHATQPQLATMLPLPRSYYDKGYRRYGFHGLNYQHVVDALPKQTGKPLPRRLLAAHLGSGASMCAILEGRSVGTTMGFSTADGLVMGTRTGSIDPGVLVALLRDEHLSIPQLEDLLYRKSGLLGLSGISSDMRVLLASDKPEAKEAVDYYCFSAAKHAGSLITNLGGLDAVVFTGGVGEHAEPIRKQIMSHLHWLGLPADCVHVVAANEELTIARATASLVPA